MIFSKLFKDKWQSKKADIRIQAVNDLDVNNAADKSILIKLIETDPDKNVRASALAKVNLFSTWLNASNNNNNSVIRDLAQQKIEDIVLGLDVITLNKEEKFSFLEQQPHLQLLEKWLFSETNTNLQITLYELLNKPQLAVKLFNESEDVKVQRYIVEQNDDIALLEKLAKKTQLVEVKSTIDNKIATIIEEQEKPIKIAKQAQLILAKYLALKDVAIYQEMLTKKEAIIAQWQLIKADFDILPQAQKTTFDDKWQSIETQLAKIFAIKAEDYQQQQIAARLQQKRLAQLDEFNQKVEQINQQLSTAIYENTNIDKVNFEQTIDQQLQAISTSVLDKQTQQKLTALFNQERKKLLQLDVIAESITQATHLISQLSQVALPHSIQQFSDKVTFYRDWQKQWVKVNTASCNLLPESINSSYQLLTTQWEEAITPLEQTLKIQFNKVKHKLGDVKRLVNSGKFNSSFGVFKQAEKSYLLLTDKQQQALAKEYTWCQEKINDLSDWETYIATPKKQALLLEIQALALQPLTSPTEQADKVKNYRKLWNSLGHAQADLEDELNTAFNLACEQAFAPCRLFYSEQDKLREQHLHTREQLIAESEALKVGVEQSAVDWKKLDSDLNKLLQKWRNSGEVDKQLYHRLNEKFNHSLAPVKNAIYSFHQDNAEMKKALVMKAEKLSLQENIEQASDEMKSLQNQWRDIGYSGPKAENKLWKAFRGFNDDVFAKRNQIQEAVIQSKNIKLVELTEQVNQLIAKVNHSVSVIQIKELVDESDALTEQLVPLMPHSSNLITKLTELVKKLKAKKKTLLAQKAEQSWQLLFNLLQSNIEQGIPFEDNPNFTELDNKWKKRLKSISSTEADNDRRKEKTVSLELIAGVKPPQSEQAVTMKIQVELMQQQLSNKEVVTLEDTFADWLALGKLSYNDLPLLARIKPLFVQSMS